MKERPILFSGPMVRAILEGRKTQTRRIYKGRPPTFYPSTAGGVWGIPIGERDKCPYGVPGDRLWVRETWQPFFEEDTGFCGVRYAAGGMPDEDERASKYLDGTDRWRPSIHMPRWASRLTLEITAVRVERLQDITEEDAKAEGVQKSQRAVSPSKAEPCWWDYLRNQADYRSPVDSFASLWESINGAGSWDSNPYVWVVEFRKVEDKR